MHRPPRDLLSELRAQNHKCFSPGARQRNHTNTATTAAKQHLKIKSFVGTSANAVHIQIWTALIALLLVKYLQLRSKWGWTLSNLIALLRWNVYTYRDLWRWIDAPFDTPSGSEVAEQTWLMWDSIQPPRATTSP